MCCSVKEVFLCTNQYKDENKCCEIKELKKESIKMFMIS